MKYPIKNYFRNFIENFPRIALVLRNLRDQINRSESFQKTPWGFLMDGNVIMASGKFEQDETKLVRSFIPQVDLLINVGANVGYYCLHALDLGKNVIAIEPLERNVHYILNNIKKINGKVDVKFTLLH